MNLNEQLIKRKDIYNGNFIDVKLDTVRLPNGKTSTREIIKHPGAVCVAALTPNREIIMVKQYRHACEKVIMELPAGKLDKNEDPLNAAIRELQEETGIIGKDFKSLGFMYVTPGYSDEIIYFYVCKVDSETKQNLDDDEFVEPIKMKLDDALNAVITGKINDAKTQLLIFKVTNLISSGSLKFI